jgi:predicted nucleic acid-binding protein
MNVVVDTSVWSEFLRTKKVDDQKHVETLKTLIRDSRAVLLGVVKQALLSGIKESAKFDVLQKVLEGFNPLLATDEDHILAAKFFNVCRSNGIQGSFSDFLICAQAFNNNMSILASDGDFVHFAKFIPLSILKGDEE